VSVFGARSILALALVLSASSLRAAPGFVLVRIETRSGVVEGEGSREVRTWVGETGARREDGREVVILDFATGNELHLDAKARTYFELSGDALAQARAASVLEGDELLAKASGARSLAPLQPTGRKRKYGKGTATAFTSTQDGVVVTAWCADGVVDPASRERVLRADAGLTQSSVAASIVGLDALRALPGYPVQIDVGVASADGNGAAGDELKTLDARDVAPALLAVPAGWKQVPAPGAPAGTMVAAPSAAESVAVSKPTPAPRSCEPMAPPPAAEPAQPEPAAPSRAEEPKPAAPAAPAAEPRKRARREPPPAKPAVAPAPAQAPESDAAPPPPSTLVEAAHQGDIDAIRKLLAAGADIEKAEGKLSYRPLHAAARWGGPAAVTDLLDAGAQRDARAAWERTPLHIAATAGNLDVVRVLVDRGADMTALDLSLDTPLALAEIVHQDAVAEYLRSKGATVRARDISWAALNGDRARIEELVAQGVDVSAPAERGQTPIVLAMSGGMEELVPFLISKGARVDVTMPDGGRQAVHFAAAWGLHDAFDQLVAAGAKKDAKDDSGATPLLVAARHAPPETITWLIEHEELDPRAETIRPAENALHLAARNGNIEVVKLLLDRGMSAGAPSSDGTVALHAAAGGNSVAVVELLLERDPGSLMAADAWGWTPLHQAARSGNLAIIRLLLSKGAKVDVLTKSEKTPASIALANDHRDAARLLVEAP